MEPFALQVFGVITAKTVPMVLDFLVDRLKTVAKNKKGKEKGEIEALKKEIDNLKRQLKSKDSIEENQIRQVEAQLEKASLIQQQYGLELISNQAHKQWILKQFEGLDYVSATQNTFEINIWTQQGTSSTPRDISIIPSGIPVSYNVGDKITFFFRTNRDCYLTLFNLGTSGNITILFPNRIFQDNFIKANETYSIPGERYSFDYVITGPTGVERIRAIASTEKVNLTDLDFSQSNKVFYSTERSAAAKDIQIVEKRIKEWSSIGWAMATYKFVVR